jgi:hypothetical protein
MEACRVFGTCSSTTTPRSTSGRLAEGLGRLEDFDAFVADVERWLAGR